MPANLQKKREAAQEWLSAHHLPQAGGWLSHARRLAAARVEAMGLPARRDEYWRWTNPAPLLAEEGATAAPGEPSAFADLDRLVLSFDDGVLDADASGEAAEVELLSEAGKADIHWVKDTYGVLESRGHAPVERPLAAINTAFAREGALIRVDGTAARPIELAYRPGSGPVMYHHVIRLDPGAGLTLLETGTPGPQSNVVIEVELGEGARFNHLRLQGPDPERAAATAVFARLAASAQAKSFTLTSGGRLTRNEAVVEFTGDDAVAHLAGIAMAGRKEHHDDTVFVTHGAERCESRQVFKKVLKAGATGVFQGKILVRPDAQKTDGYQISQALLLDESATFQAKPELEIYADDVKCSHGSTSGAIDETALYYLRSRGIPKADAERLMVRAFLAEALAEIEDPTLSEMVLARLIDWLDREE